MEKKELKPYLVTALKEGIPVLVKIKNILPEKLDNFGKLKKMIFIEMGSKDYVSFIGEKDFGIVEKGKEIMAIRISTSKGPSISFMQKVSTSEPEQQPEQQPTTTNVTTPAQRELSIVTQCIFKTIYDPCTLDTLKTQFAKIDTSIQLAKYLLKKVKEV